MSRHKHMSAHGTLALALALMFLVFVCVAIAFILFVGFVGGAWIWT